MQILTFELEKDEYAINIENIVSIEKMKKITSVPHMTNAFLGIIEFREQVIPLLDLKDYLGKEKTKENDENKIIIVTISNKNIGLLVNRAKDIVKVDEKNIESFTFPSEEQIDAIKIINQEDKLYVLLDMEKVLSERDIEKIVNKIKSA